MPKIEPAAVASKTRPYFRELDGVRAIAALMVMVFHFGQDWFYSSFLVLGQTGVDLFFVLSGFLITTILLQSPHGDWHEIKNFYIRRTLRIFPLYYFYLLLASLIGGLVSVWYWVYLQNIAAAFLVPLRLAPLYGPDHFWSLGVEEQFYLVWPFLILFWPRRWLPHAIWAAVALAFVMRVGLIHTQVNTFQFILTRLDGLAGGALLAFYYSTGKLHRCRPLLIALGSVGIVSMGVEKLVSHGTGVPWVEVVKYSSATALYASIVGLLVTTQTTPIHRMLGSGPMRAIGRVSYGMYVYHPAIFFYLPRYLVSIPLLAKAFSCFLTAYVVSLASYYGFEKRIMELKERFATEKPVKPLAAVVS